MDEVSQLDRVVEDLRSEVVTAIRSAAVRAGTLVAGFEVCYDEACDRLDEIARLFGPEAAAAVLAGLDSGMEHPDDVTEDTFPGPTAAPTPPQPAPASQALREGFRDADECAAGVVAWASARLVADPDAQTASADLAQSWAEFDGRRLVGFASVTEAVSAWAAGAGVAADRCRNARRRGLSGLRLVAGDTPAAHVTVSDDTPAPDVNQPAAELIQRRAPNGGVWQTVDDLAGADATSDDWFTVG